MIRCLFFVFLISLLLYATFSFVYDRFVEIGSRYDNITSKNNSGNSKKKIENCANIMSNQPIKVVKSETDQNSNVIFRIFLASLCCTGGSRERFPKGQIISECLFDFFKFSKKPPKNLTNFCPRT